MKINKKMFFENGINKICGMLKRSFYKYFLKTLINDKHSDICNLD